MEGLGTNALEHQLSTAMNARNTAGLENFKNRLTGNEDAQMDKIKDAAEEFESVFLAQMLSHMFSGIEVDPMFGGGKGEEMFKGMIVEEYGKHLSATGGIGITEQVQAKLIEMQSQL